MARGSKTPPLRRAGAERMLKLPKKQMSYRVTDLSTNGPTDEETYRSYGMGQKYSNTSIMNMNRIRIVGKELYIFCLSVF